MLRGHGLPKQLSPKSLLMVVSKRWFEFSGGAKFHWEIKGRFRKRVVLANVPSFRFSFRGNICRNHPFGNHPFVNTKKGHWEIKGRFPKGWFWRTCPRSGFRSGGTSAETNLLETALLQTPENSATPFLPQFNLLVTSVSPLFNPFFPLSNLNLTSASSRISSHGLETTVYGLLAHQAIKGACSGQPLHSLWMMRSRMLARLLQACHTKPR